MWSTCLRVHSHVLSIRCRKRCCRCRTTRRLHVSQKQVQPKWYHKTSKTSHEYCCTSQGLVDSRLVQVTISRHIHISSKSYLNIDAEHLVTSIMTSSHRIVHQCRNCPKLFDTHYELVNHSRVHSDYRPYICTKQGCGKKFRWRSCLRYHQNNAVCIRKSRRGGYRRKKQVKTAISNQVADPSTPEPISSPPSAIEDSFSLPSLFKHLKPSNDPSILDNSPPSLPSFSEFLLAPEHLLPESNIPQSTNNLCSSLKPVEPLHFDAHNVEDVRPSVHQGNGTDGLVRMFVDIMYDPLV